jgi:hypothetical protein
MVADDKVEGDASLYVGGLSLSGRSQQQDSQSKEDSAWVFYKISFVSEAERKAEMEKVKVLINRRCAVTACPTPV